VRDRSLAANDEIRVIDAEEIASSIGPLETTLRAIDHDMLANLSGLYSDIWVIAGDDKDFLKGSDAQA